MHSGKLETFPTYSHFRILIVDILFLEIVQRSGSHGSASLQDLANIKLNIDIPGLESKFSCNLLHI